MVKLRRGLLSNSGQETHSSNKIWFFPSGLISFFEVLPPNQSGPALTLFWRLVLAKAEVLPPNKQRPNRNENYP